MLVNASALVGCATDTGLNRVAIRRDVWWSHEFSVFILTIASTIIVVIRVEASCEKSAWVKLVHAGSVIQILETKGGNGIVSNVIIITIGAIFV